MENPMASVTLAEHKSHHCFIHCGHFVSTPAVPPTQRRSHTSGQLWSSVGFTYTSVADEDAATSRQQVRRFWDRRGVVIHPTMGNAGNPELTLKMNINQA